MPYIGQLTKRLTSAISWLFISGFVSITLWIFYGEVAIFIRHDYTIAHVLEVYRGNKFEKKISYYYTVQGKRYERGSAWDGKVLPGERYVVKYATYAPYGNDFLYKHPVPDSIQQANGSQWQAFLHKRQLFYRIPSHIR